VVGGKVGDMFVDKVGGVGEERDGEMEGKIDGGKRWIERLIKESLLSCQ
jgi:hypothetical protein